MVHTSNFPVCPKVTGNTPLMYAAMENKLSMVDRMIDLGCDINAKNKVDKKFLIAYKQGQGGGERVAFRTVPTNCNLSRRKLLFEKVK